MLGLEAAIANIVRRGDKVLVVSNGVFGEGFADLVRMYGGIPEIIECDWRRSIDVGSVENVYERHRKAREASWRALEAAGLKPYPESK
ncbi:MAG: hypothetical protein QXI22_02930 [Sulfolobales archaeon]